METTTSLLPLTTTFTPDPGCNDVYLRDCTDGSTCVGEIYRNQVWQCMFDTTTINQQQSCFPVTSSSSEVHYTFSPGLICPHGMTTAASAISPNGVWCCPSSLSWVGYPLYCGGLMTEGSYITSSFACSTTPWTVSFGPHATDSITAAVRPAGAGRTEMMVTKTIPASDVVLSVYAMGVFLSGQTWSTSSPEPTSSSTDPVDAKTKVTLSPTSAGTSQRDPADQGDASGEDGKGWIGAVVGSILGAALLLALGFFLVKRHREKNRAGTRIAELQDAQDKPDYYRGNEYELEGSRGDNLKGANRVGSQRDTCRTR